MIASIFSYLKRRLPVVLIGAAAILLVVFLVKNAGGSRQEEPGDAEIAASMEESIVETQDIAVTGDSTLDADTSRDSDETTKADSIASEASVKYAANTESSSANDDQDKTDDSSKTDSSSEEGDSSAASGSSLSEDTVKSEATDSDTEKSNVSDEGSNSDESEKTAESLESASSALMNNSPAAVPEDIDFDSFAGDYPEAVAWIWFEDGLLSYPVMQASDNDKYKHVDYTGAEARTGSIFLDSRSSENFTDPNTIIYGHNMSDGSMFGLFKKYKYDRKYLKGHEYFQIITRDGTQRYRIFAYMDLPKSSDLYNICGPGTDRMKTLTDYLEHRTYVDSGIEAKPDDQLIMLSTCTDKDDLYFVVFGMRID